MKNIETIATIQYRQDPITGFKAYDTDSIEIPITLIFNGSGQVSIRFKYSFQHAKTNEKIELGINYTYDSNPNIWVDFDKCTLPKDVFSGKYKLVIKENKFERSEAPWALPREFSLEFFI